MELKDVKIGDRIKCAQQYSSRDDLYTVARLTKTLAVCVKPDGSFRIDTGTLVGSGGGYRQRRGHIATAAEIASISEQIRIRRATEALSRFRVTAKNLDAVEALLNNKEPT